MLTQMFFGSTVLHSGCPGRSKFADNLNNIQIDLIEKIGAA